MEYHGSIFFKKGRIYVYMWKKSEIYYEVKKARWEKVYLILLPFVKIGGKKDSLLYS